MDTRYLPLPKRVLSPFELEIPWHRLKGRVYFMLIEAQLIITIICLFLVGYPAATRKALWEEGGEHGFNSDPKMRIYFYANYVQPPEIPYIWSRRYVVLFLISWHAPANTSFLLDCKRDL